MISAWGIPAKEPLVVCTTHNAWEGLSGRPGVIEKNGGKFNQKAMLGRLIWRLISVENPSVVNNNTINDSDVVITEAGRKASKPNLIGVTFIKNDALEENSESSDNAYESSRYIAFGGSAMIMNEANVEMGRSGLTSVETRTEL